MSIGNTLEALLGAYLLRHFLDFHNALDRIRDVVSLVGVSLVVTTIGATFGSVTLALINNSLWQAFGSIWITWWIGDLLGALVVAPLLLTWLGPPWLKSRWQRYVEGVAIFVVLGLITWYVFSNNPPTGISHQALLYVLFPLMIWVALRFGARGAATGLFLVSCIAILWTTQGSGPFSLESINDSLVLLQTFTAVVSLTSMINGLERKKRILQESEDPEMSILLLDFILGYNSSMDPVGEVLDAILEAKKRARDRGGNLNVVASMCGTESDVQDIKIQTQMLRDAGVVVFNSNAEATQLCAELIA
jgi:integral membrane sensor domain MASE1